MDRYSRRGALSLLGGVVLSAGCLEVEPDRSLSVLPGDLTNIAHQGGALLAPGNTLEAYEQAVEAGADVIEIDLKQTADGVFVAMHDETVDRTTNGTGRVVELSFEEIRSLDAGYNWTRDDGETYPYRGTGIVVPSLEEILEAFPEVPLLIEPKRETIPPEDLVEMLRSYDRIDDVLLGAFEDHVLEDYRELEPAIATGLGPKEGRELLLTTRASEAHYETPAEVVFPPHGVVSETVVGRAHRAGLAVVPWTVNERSAMERMRSLGVDGIITDDPETLATLLD